MPGILRKSDTISRLGGDEFAILMPAVDGEYAMRVANKLLKSLQETLVIEGNNLFIGASIGITLYPDHGDDASTLLQRADVAMYVAKNMKCGLSIYSQEYDQHSLKHLVLNCTLYY